MNTTRVHKEIRKPLIISLFSGAGGLDLGFQEEGYKIALAIDNDASAIETHKFNFESASGVVADLSKIGPKGVLNYALETIPKGGRIGIIGGPPCQGFSRANPSSKPDDPRNLLPRLYIQIIEELKKHYIVEFVVFENVLGMKDKKHTVKYLDLIKGLKELDFDLSEKELCAHDFGVPQNRNRIVVTALRSGQGYQPVYPEKTVGTFTVKSTIGELIEPAFFHRNLKKEDIPLHPNHWTMQPKSAKFRQPFDNSNKSRSFRKLNWDKPSPTIAFGNREIHVHPSGLRRISIYEAMLLQGFPKSFILKGTLSQQVQQISNAVPPPLAKSLAEAVTKSMQKSGNG
ncbi:DNA cytosine methyltransferase [Dyadobacter fanqingshengii]|uniref:DNA (cytosine-5-)-methyltransferase n=1 Tax=Dyadobacter fanqingshengii TaxID=2906443 RepID=A0A9X1PBK2_9BACT|nr:DNA cytosine methyltransferase [Dyadobacter fanqingshengii]MCF0041560.1 DNA cytosine methyltransferase [Dyadobacter fanqingshengii]USJ36723.1 DNA cytosine methyltransferase [Dyadobacter fanqingshengii]